LHGPGGEPMMVLLTPLEGIRLTVAGALSSLAGSLFGPMIILFLLFVLRVLLRKEWAAAAVCAVLVGFLGMGAPSGYLVQDLTLNVIQGAALVFVLMRFGLIALIATSSLSDYLLNVPRTLDFSQWYAPMGMLPLVLMALVAIYGFYKSVGDRPVFGSEIG
jgi:hypothetical protein